MHICVTTFVELRSSFDEKIFGMYVEWGRIWTWFRVGQFLEDEVFPYYQH